MQSEDVSDKELMALMMTLTNEVKIEGETKTYYNIRYLQYSKYDMKEM